MAVIRKDKHGLYVKAGGYIFRPVFPRGYNHAYDDGSKHQVGDKVRATHCSAGPLGKIGGEYWYAHGAYLGRCGDSNSENNYKPNHDNWS